MEWREPVHPTTPESRKACWGSQDAAEEHDKEEKEGNQKRGEKFVRRERRNFRESVELLTGLFER